MIQSKSNHFTPSAAHARRGVINKVSVYHCPGSMCKPVYCEVVDTVDSFRFTYSKLFTKSHGLHKSKIGSKVAHDSSGRSEFN